MPFTREILRTTIKNTVVKFTHDGTGTPAISALTGGIFWADYPFSITGATNGQVDISRVLWSISENGSAVPASVAIAWDIPGSVTGSPCLYLSGSGVFDFNEKGMSITSPLTGNNKTNGVTVRNSSAFAAGEVATIIMELTNTKGFGATG